MTRAADLPRGLPEPAPVPVYTAVDEARFFGEIQPKARPALLKGAVKDWPIVRAIAEQGLAASLTAYASVEVEAFEAPPEVGGRFFYTDDFQGFNFTRKRLTLGALLDDLAARAGVAEPGALYAGAVPLQGLLGDIAAYNPPPFLPVDRERLQSLWIGNRTRAAAHWDLPQNLACNIAGRRRFILFPTAQVSNLYIGPLDRTIAGQPVTCVDIEGPDLGRFPRFVEAWSAAEVAILEPGDVLYLPSLWIHEVRGLDPIGAMVNFWWRDGPSHLVSPFQTLLHAVLTLRDLPEPERLAWREVFDHFIFQMHGEPQAHLSEEARGVFGPASDDILARIRRHIAQSLLR